MSTSDKKVAVVAGAAGIIGRNLILHLSKIYGISRRVPDYASRQTHLAIDLLSDADTDSKLSKVTNVTHVFFAAYQEKPSLAEQIPPNLAMLRNLVAAVEKHSPTLQHVCLVEGTKWYGCHLGPIKTPSKEDDVRQMPPNFYYDQEDFLVGRVKAGAKWNWSAHRPNPVCGFALGNPMNIVTCIAVYGSICKALGIPLRYPGTPQGFDVLLECVDVEVLSQAMVWTATTPACANQAYNVSNGDLFRWSNIWPALAKFFDLPSETRPVCQISLAQMLSDKKPLWNELVKKYSLQATPFEDIALWGFADWVFSRNYDWFSDVSKLRRTGFHVMNVDSEEMFVRMLTELRKQKVIP